MKKWITKSGLAACGLFCLTGLLNLWQDAVDHRRMEAVCGEWATIYPQSRLSIREQKGYYMLTFYRLTNDRHVEVSNHRLQGGRSLHFGSGKAKTYLWLSEDGKTLQLIPGNCYKLSTTKTKNDEKKNHEAGSARREPLPVGKTELRADRPPVRCTSAGRTIPHEHDLRKLDFPRRSLFASDTVLFDGLYGHGMRQLTML